MSQVASGLVLILLLAGMSILVFNATLADADSAFIRDFKVVIRPESPIAGSDEVNVMVSFWILEAQHSVDFGNLAQAGNTFSVNISVSMIGLPIVGPWTYNHTYHLGTLSRGSYLFDAYVFMSETLIPLASASHSFAVTAMITVPDDYPTIQEAINAASDGDTVYVQAGTYYGNLTIDKSLTLRGENRTNTLITTRRTKGISILIDVRSDNVVLSGFTVQNGSWGVFLRNVTGTVINRNMITLNHFAGIRLESSNHCVISDNLIISNKEEGIWLTRSHNNVARNNIVSHSLCGVDLYMSERNVITGNSIVDNWSHNIYLCDSNHTTLRHNTVSNSIDGIWVLGSSHNYISENTVLNNSRGIYLSTLESPGAFHPSTMNNTIVHNSLINNTEQVCILGNPLLNLWDLGFLSGGNYWSDYQERYPNATEIDHSGIWDTPYVIDENNQDNNPLRTPWPLRLPLPLLRVEPESSMASRVGEILSVNITINDLDVSCCMSYVQVALRYNSTILELLDVVDGPFMKEVADTYPPVQWGERKWITYLFLTHTEPGYIVVQLMIRHPPIWVRTYPEGNGTLATLTFQVTNITRCGQSILQLVDTFLCDEGLTEIPHSTVSGYCRILVGDANADGIVDVLDVTVAAQAFGSCPDHLRWNPRADVDNNNLVNIIDLVSIAKNFGKTASQQ